MSILSWVSSLYSSAPPINTVEGVYWWAQIGTLLLLSATIITGAVTVATGIVSSRRQSAKNLVLQQGIIDAQKELEQERLTRVLLEKSIAPRLIPISFQGPERNFDPLKLFAGTNVEIESLPDAEPRRVAGALLTILRESGWTMVATVVRDDIDDRFNAGIRIEQYGGTKSASKALLAFLTVNHIHASDFPPPKPPAGAPVPDKIRILVSLQPNPYFSDRFFEEQMIALGSEKQIQQMRQAIDLASRLQEAEAKELWERLWRTWRERQNKTPTK